MGTRTRAAKIAIGTGIALALSGASFAKDTQSRAYSVYDVKSKAECQKLCDDDAKHCRGTLIRQLDVTKADRICHLDNGTGENEFFPRVAPAPVDFAVALEDLNRYRAQYGLGEVRYNPMLNKASKVHADDMAQAGIISHDGTDGSNHGDRLEVEGYLYEVSSENVAAGQRSWPQVFRAWQDSPSHNKALLSPDVEEFGLALSYEPDTRFTTYWAMLVAKPLSLSYSVQAKSE